MGAYNENEGMYAYFLAWIDQLKRDKINYSNDLSGNNTIINKPIRFCLNIGYSFYIPFLILLFPWFLFSSYIYCAKLNKKNLSRLHIVDDFVYSSIHIFILSIFFKGEVLITIHDPTAHPNHVNSIFSKIVYSNNRKFISFLTNRFHNINIHIHSLRLWEESSIFGKLNCVIAPHPIPNKKRQLVKSDKFSLSFLLIGRLESYKGLQIFIDAILKLKNENKQLFESLSFGVVGRGDIDTYDWYDLLNYHNFILVNSFLESKNFENYISNASCIVFPYTSATSSGVGSLAAAYKIPVIVSDVGDLATFADYSPSSIILEKASCNNLYEAMVKFIRNEKI